MKAIRIPIMAILAAAILVVPIGIFAFQQHVYAPRECGGCTAFKKLTHEFEMDVIDAAKSGDLGLIPSLLEQYNDDVRALDLIPRG
jgi:hypothetical protein